MNNSDLLDIVYRNGWYIIVMTLRIWIYLVIGQQYKPKSDTAVWFESALFAFLHAAFGLILK